MSHKNYFEKLWEETKKVITGEKSLVGEGFGMNLPPPKSKGQFIREQLRKGKTYEEAMELYGKPEPEKVAEQKTEVRDISENTARGKTKSKTLFSKPYGYKIVLLLVILSLGYLLFTYVMPNGLGNLHIFKDEFTIKVFSEGGSYKLKYTFLNDNDNSITEETEGEYYRRIDIKGKLKEVTLKGLEYYTFRTKIEIWKNGKIIYERDLHEVTTIHFKN